MSAAREGGAVLARGVRLFGDGATMEAVVAPFAGALGFRARELVAGARAALTNRAGEPDAESLQALARVIRLARPVVCVGTNFVDVLEGVFSPDDPRYGVVSGVLSRIAPRVVRVEFGPGEIAGSALRVGPDRVLTHASVLDAVTSGTGAVVVGDVHVRLGHEQGARESDTRMVLGVKRESGDLVELGVEVHPSGIEAEMLPWGAPREGESVVLIGHPAADAVYNPPFVGVTLGRSAGVKRMAFGEVTRVEGARVEHDALATLGSGGGVLVSLETGAVVGIHAQRAFAWRAWAVSLAESPGISLAGS